jgi:hypothetical protein
MVIGLRMYAASFRDTAESRNQTAQVEDFSRRTTMTKTTYWRLTIHFWPRAAEAGIQPVVSHGFEGGEQYYRPRSIDFEHPPSREEFIEIVNRVPWMQAAWHKLLPILAKNSWPMLDNCHKSATVDLHDEESRCVGRLEVCREERWMNRGYIAPFVSTEACRAVTRHLRRRIEAAEYLDANRYVLMERIAMIPNWTEEIVFAEMRSMLIEGGFLKAREAG